MRRTKMHLLRACLLLLPALMLLAGCVTVGPDYVAPETNAPPAWNAATGGSLKAGRADPEELAHWWETFQDPVLTSLIDRAVKGNLDLKEASARVREARARRTAAGAGLLPALDSTASFQRSGDSESARNLYSAGFDARWEIDLFGGVRRSVEAADADLQAASEAMNDTLVTLSAEVALNYVEVRTFQSRLETAEANLALQQETYRIEQSLAQAGLSDALALQRARSNLESTRALIPSLRASLEEAKNRLAVLLGEHPGAVHKKLALHGPVPLVPPAISIDAPADILRHRPDVRQAERELAAQSARVGVAMAELYPRITLNGSIGLSAVSSGDLLTAGSRTFSYGPRITLPIFSAGSIRAGIEARSALQEQALIRYESAVLTALEEVENALNAYAQELERRSALQESAQAAQEAAELAEHQYRSGLVDFTALLDTQRSLLSAQDELVRNSGALTSNLVRLYKALGGGWPAHEAEQYEKEGS
ncbi:MAG TPA: efflux transporter outer membrane subunit [Deltaproteobacteria bacterium]|nr:efflux transporter outer membrane subunit [Deltaproteobacteria bacterium]